MASWQDLKPVCDQLGAGCVYYSQPAGWFKKLATDAGIRPQVINVKGVAPKDAVIMLRLTEYEELRRKAAG